MSISLSPLEPTAPRDPLVGIEGARYLPDGAAVVGSVRGQAAIRFDCAGRRYDVWADPDQADRLPDVAAALSAAAGCDVLAVGEG